MSPPRDYPRLLTPDLQDALRDQELDEAVRAFQGLIDRHGDSLELWAELLDEMAHHNVGWTDWTEALIAGFVGSFVGGLLASLIAGDGLDFRPSGLIGSILGAIIVTAVWGLVRGRRTA